MKTIWKYSLPSELITADGHCSLSVPKYSRILSVQTQDNMPTIWMEIDEDLKDTQVVYRFQCVMTGRAFPQYGRYLGTVQLDDGSFVFHVYQI